MPATEDITTPLVPGQMYHIFNRGINRANIFFKHENYLYFMNKYIFYLSPYLDTFAYCLLPNHFHLMVRVKEEHELACVPNRQDIFKKNVMSDPSSVISERFRRLFVSYAKAVNKQEKRVGSLFQRPFRRRPVRKQTHFMELFRYIHLNPLYHGITKSFENYHGSSYAIFSSEKESFIEINETFQLFGGKQCFIEYHQLKNNSDLNKDILIE